MIDFSGAQPPWPASAMRLWEQCTADASRGSAADGNDVLRTEIGDHLGVSGENLTIVAGARAAAAAYGRIADRLALERPTFLGIAHAFTATRAQWHHFCWENLDEVPPGTAVWVTSPFRNPDGRSLTRCQVSSLQRRCASGGRVVINRSYQWFGPEPLIHGPEMVISLHKIAGREARIAAVCSPSFTDEARDFLPFLSPPMPWQLAWGLFIRRRGLDLLHGSYACPSMSASAAFWDTLGGLWAEGAPSGPGPSALLPLRPGIEENAAVTALTAKGYAVVAGRYFASTFPAIRVTFSGISEAEAAEFARVLASSGLLGHER
jgi:DNA-binding transcriptional MocR family regulator